MQGQKGTDNLGMWLVNFRAAPLGLKTTKTPANYRLIWIRLFHFRSSVFHEICQPQSDPKYSQCCNQSFLQLRGMLSNFYITGDKNLRKYITITDILLTAWFIFSILEMWNFNFIKNAQKQILRRGSLHSDFDTVMFRDSTGRATKKKILV